MLEVLLTVSSAYVLKKRGIFSEEHSKVLVNYVLYFALPLLSFKISYKMGMSGEVLAVATGAWLVIALSLFVSYIFGKLLKLDKANLKALIVISSFGNTAFLGYPYSYTYFGEAGLRYAVIYDSIGSFFMVSSIAPFILSGRIEVKSVLLFPPFLGLVLGFMLKGYHIPDFLWKFIDFSTASLLPVILFSLGLSLELSRILKEGRLLTVAIFTKMLISPAFALFVLKLLPLNSLAYKVSVLESTMPTMIYASVLVLKYGLNHNLAFASAGLGIILSFLTVPFWVYVLEVLPF
ncbi:MAG: AEC family transporter [Aquificaceae bacterium]|nr:AEC family transporter [Aquificaceae bacterium]